MLPSQLDLRELLKRGNGLFGSAEQTGSLGVVTINCARLGYVFAQDEEGLFNRLNYLLDLARNSLEIKRKIIQRLRIRACSRIQDVISARCVITSLRSV